MTKSSNDWKNSNIASLSRRDFIASAVALGGGVIANAVFAGETKPPRELKIAKIDAFPIQYPLAGRFKFFEGGPPGRPAGRPSVLVKITADDGSVGWGQSVPVPKWSCETIESVYYTITRYLAPLLVGRDAFDHEGICDAMNHAVVSSFSTGQPICKAGIDLALFDLTGRALGQNAAQRWNKKGRDKLTISWTLNPKALDEVEKLVAQGRERGYKNFNVKIAPDPKADLELCRLVKKLAPDGFLWADANCGYDEQTALDIAPKLADIGVAVFEGPLPPNHINGYRALKKLGAIPIIMDEGLVSCVELREFIDLGMLDGVSMKPGRCGGIIEAKRQIELCLDRGLIWLGSGICDPDLSLAASLALFGAFDLKTPAALNGLQFTSGSILKSPLTIANGELAVPSGPGLGVEVNESAIAQFILKDI